MQFLKTIRDLGADVNLVSELLSSGAKTAISDIEDNRSHDQSQFRSFNTVMSDPSEDSWPESKV